MQNLQTPCFSRLQPHCLFTYNIASREVAYWVFSGQRDGAEHDEDQDEVGEDLMVDQLMAEYTNPTWKQKGNDSRLRDRALIWKDFRGCPVCDGALV